MNSDHNLLIGEIVHTALEHGITVKFSHTEKVVVPGESEDLGCSGFFCTNDKILYVATDKPFNEWFFVLLHEYNHLLQWIEDKETFENADDDAFWEWLDGNQELEEEHIKNLADSLLSYEIDCEERTAKIVEKLDMNASEYIKKANSYLYLYPMIVKHRKWCTKTPPYKVPELVELMPDHFVDDYWDVSEEIEETIVKGCFNEERESE